MCLFIYSYTCGIFKVLSTYMLYKDLVLQLWNFPFDELEHTDQMGASTENIIHLKLCT